MTWVAESFPLVAFLAASALALYVLITRNKLARGSKSAGLVITPVQDVHGLKSEPWAVTSIAADLKKDASQTLGTVSSLCHSVGIDSNQGFGVSVSAVHELVERLERHLELEPLIPTQQSPIGKDVSAAQNNLIHDNQTHDNAIGTALG